MCNIWLEEIYRKAELIELLISVWLKSVQILHLF